MFVRTIQRKSSHRNIAVQIVESYRNNKAQALLLQLNNQAMDADGFKLLDTEHDGRRLVLSYSPKLASKQRSERAELIEKLQKKLGKGGKAVGNLIGNSKYRKWIKMDYAKVAELDIEAIEAQESRLDGNHRGNGRYRR